MLAEIVYDSKILFWWVSWKRNRQLKEEMDGEEGLRKTKSKIETLVMDG